MTGLMIQRLKGPFAHLVALAFVISGCIGTDKIDDLGTVEPKVNIESGSIYEVDTIEVGESITYSAFYFNSGGVEQAADFTWTSSDESLVTINDQGVATGVGGGIATIMAMANGTTGERLIYVEQLNRIELSVSQPSLLVGGTLQVNGQYYDDQGNPQTTTLTWSSSDNNVFTIDANGLITGVGNGQAEVRAMANGVSSLPLLITVVDNANSVASVTLTSPVNSFMEGGMMQLTATANNVNGMNLSGKTFVFTSDNPSVVSVDQNGMVTAEAVGTARITAVSEGISSPALELVVTPAAVSSRTGNFMGTASYSVSGSVTMQQGSGSLELEFSPDFSTDNGPGLYIYLSNSTSGGIDVVALPQTSGAFTVSLPSNIGINDYNYVLIWCQPFGVTFGSALLN